MDNLGPIDAALRLEANGPSAASSTAPKPQDVAGGARAKTDSEAGAPRRADELQRIAELHPDELHSLEQALQAEVERELQRSDVRISYDQDISRFVIEMRDPETGEVRRQIPSEQVLDVHRRLRELRGLLVDEKS